MSLLQFLMCGNTKYKCIYFTALDDNSQLSLTKVGTANPDLKVSSNGRTWQNWDGSAINVNAGDIVYVRGDNPTGFNTQSNYVKFTTVGRFRCDGDIMGLLGNKITQIPGSQKCFLVYLKVLILLLLQT